MERQKKKINLLTFADLFTLAQYFCFTLTFKMLFSVIVERYLSLCVKVIEECL